MAYIHPSARASYRHWWEQQTKSVWWYEDHPNMFEKRQRRRRTKWGYGNRYIRPWDISTSGESSFRQNGYEPKTKDQVKEDWRELKGFTRDKAKRDRRGCPRWIKRQCNKDYRQFERRCIESGQHEKLSSKLRKDFFDPWMWD
jgi:hypothetical protein